MTCDDAAGWYESAARTATDGRARVIRPGPIERATSAGRVVASDPPPAHFNRCQGDGQLCYTGAGTDEAHWRCGTTQCGKAIADDAVIAEDAQRQRAKEAAFRALALFMACKDGTVVYDFSSETEMRDDAFVITFTATPRRIA